LYNVLADVVDTGNACFSGVTFAAIVFIANAIDDGETVL
jgi:hypothetical protein